MYEHVSEYVYNVYACAQVYMCVCACVYADVCRYVCVFMPSYRRREELG